jgi:hypothetical protein
MTCSLLLTTVLYMAIRLSKQSLIADWSIAVVGDDELMQPRAVGLLLSKSTATLWRWRRDGIGPECVRTNSKTAKRATYGYWRSAIETWLKEQQS